MGAAHSRWDVQVDGGVVVVELGRRLSLDERGSQRLHADIATAVSGGGVDRVTVVVNVEHPLGAPLRDALVRAAHTAAASGVTDWHVVAEHEAKATAMASELPRVETAVLAREQWARPGAA